MFMSPIIALHHLKCAISKHKVALDDEDELFKSSEPFLDTECEKCKTPIRLTKKEGTDDYYYVSELRFITLPQTV